MHKYLYVHSEPVNGIVDPSGLQFSAAGLGASIAIGASIGGVGFGALSHFQGNGFANGFKTGFVVGGLSGLGLFAGGFVGTGGLSTAAAKSLGAFLFPILIGPQIGYAPQKGGSLDNAINRVEVLLKQRAAELHAYANRNILGAPPDFPSVKVAPSLFGYAMLAPPIYTRILVSQDYLDGELPPGNIPQETEIAALLLHEYGHRLYGQFFVHLAGSTAGDEAEDFANIFDDFL